MLRNRIVGIVAVTVFFVAASSVGAAPQSKGLITEKTISTDMALTMAQAAIAKCRSENYHVSVHVIDASGLDKVAMRDDGSGAVNFTVSKQKAFTALTYRRPSSVMEKAMANMSPARIIPGIFAVGGGLPIIVDGQTIGAIGVGGAPGSDKDEACAAAGLAKVANLLK
ncbi:MAG TPA: heme-binding protein [Candidatus Dormibacteraeota bacterium]|nr:heme-binding protein [Candidatus Dormibacteraeota bacterium]